MENNVVAFPRDGYRSRQKGSVLLFEMRHFWWKKEKCFTRLTYKYHIVHQRNSPHHPEFLPPQEFSLESDQILVSTTGMYPTIHLHF